MEPGIYYDIPWDEYKAIPLLSPSVLKAGLRSMKRLKRTIDGECRPSEKTVAIGNAVHCFIAGEVDRVAVMPAFELDEENVTATGKKSTSKTTSYFKAKSAQWLEENGGKTILSEVEKNIAQKTVREIYANQSCKRLIDRSKHEVTVISEIGGLKTKTRIDLLDAKNYGIADTKTTSDIEPRAFWRTFNNLKYAFQFAFHCLAVSSAPGGFEPQEYNVIAAEVQDDFDVGLIEVPFALLDQWKDRVLSTIEQYRLAHAAGNFAGVYPLGYDQLYIPNWAMEVEGVFDG